MAIISDINSDLMEVYLVMRDYSEELKQKLLYHQRNHSKDYYYKVRAMRPRTSVNRAARFLYLNRTCFNGMYRVNCKGQFNVPIGSKKNFVNDVDDFQNYSKLLNNIQILSEDFSVTIGMAKHGDLLFVDPPYAMKEDAHFLKYNDKLFDWKDQNRLFDCLINAREKGVHILMTNAYCDEIATMYRDANFYVSEETHICSIAGKTDKRKQVKELLISSRKLLEARND